MMAEEPMLSLFDTDTSFLEELTGPGNSEMGHPQGLGVMPGAESGMLAQSLQGMQTRMAPQQPDALLIAQQQQVAPSGYNQVHNLPQDNFGNMPPQSSVMNQQFGREGYNQYTSVPKLHHMNEQMMVGGQGQTIMSQGLPRQQQYNSPPAGSSLMQHPSGGYQNYGMSTGPRLPTPPQQQMGMSQNSVWNHNQTSPTHPQYISQQQQQQISNSATQIPPYLSQHEYAATNTRQPVQCLGHYPDSSSPGQAGSYMQGMGSPPPGNRVPMAQVPSPNSVSMLSQIQQRPVKPAQPFHQANQPTGQQSVMPSFTTSQPQSVQQMYPGDFLTRGPQMSSGTTQQSKLQHYSYTSNQQAPQQLTQGIGETSSLSHYPNQSPTNNMPYGAPFPGMQQQRATTPSPRPTPTPPSLTPSHPSTVSQGNFGQSSLQQLEQLVPSMGGMANTNPFQRVMQSSPASTMNMVMAQKAPIYSSSNFQTATVPSTTGHIANSSVQSSAGISVNTSHPIHPCATGPVSPSRGMIQGVANQQSVNDTIQHLQQQIQQLYNMPQTQQIQRQMLDLQERVRILKAQQQQQILQMQQRQQQVHQQQSGSTQLRLPQQGQQQRILIMAQRPCMPVSQPQPQMQAQVGQQQQRVHAQTPLSQPSMNPQQQTPPSQPSISQLSPTPPKTPQGMMPVSSPQRGLPFMQPLTPNSQPEQVLQLPTSNPLQTELEPQAQAPPLLQLQSFPQPDTINMETSLEDHIALSPPTLDSIPATIQLDLDEMEANEDSLVKKTKAQDKANRIIAEAIAKAQAAGQTEIPRILSPAPIPSTVSDIAEIDDVIAEKTPKKKKKRERKPKGDKPPKTKKTKVGASVVAGNSEEVGTGSVLDAEEKKEKKESEKKEKKPKTPKAKTPAKKKKPPATFLKNKKKRKRGASSDVSDLDLTPPGSPKDDDSLKRRSARNTKRKKYHDEVELNLSDDNPEVDIEGIDGPLTMKPVQFFLDNPAEEDAVVVEKILGMKMRRMDQEEIEENPDEPEEEEEFLVKYKNYSYLHCEWKTVRELERDKRIHMKIKRYKMKRLQMNNFFDQPEDEEYFNPDYVEVDRVLEVSVSTDPVTEEEVTHFLVKWRGLSYEESTWELQQDVDPKKVELFYRLRVPPPEDEREIKARPTPDEWKQLDASRDYKGGNKLREYQLEGVNWLTFCWYNGQNCILADEMGLGKTIQSITFLNEMYVYGVKRPYLVVAPLSTIANWQREFETWTDMNVIVYHGTSPSRNMLQEYEMYYKDENGHRIPNLYRFNALITTYEIIISDCELLSSIEWRSSIIDEAHRLKNKNCRLMEGLKQFDIEHSVLLTGTPLQNNTEELFSLLNFLDPFKFSNSQAFVNDFGDLKTENQVDELKKILKPMMLRRLKEDVEKNLAPKEETIIEVELTNIQKKYYRAILERNFQFLSKGPGTSANVPNLMNTMMELRKCCNHPYLVKGAEEKIVEDVKQKHGLDAEHLFLAMVQSCGKMVLLDKLLPKLKQGGHKVLVFSQMIRVLDILEDYLIHKKYMYERLDGRIRGNIRQEAIDRFSKPDSDRFVFLLCTRAGGLGINLTAADTVVIYDSDWNPQNDLQAQARCHRIGQSKAVKVYRLITRNSYEREMFDRASLKLGLDKAVLQSMGGDKPVNPQSQMSKKEIEELLKKGAYGALMEDDKAGDEFCEEDIDLILKRRTQVIQIESEGKGSTFAKASFSMTSNRSDIDINDPNFWQKWAKKADLDVDELKHRNNLIIEEPRQRKQTARYGNEDGMLEMSDLESSDDGSEEDGGRKGGRRSGRKKRCNRNDEDFEPMEEVSGDGFMRSECFKVEKNLLVYGWGRWSEILSHGRFKRKLEEKDVESIARAILVHSLQFYKGDERIKGFIWDLVSQNNEDQLKNHSGLSAPVPRGRKGKKAKKEGKGFPMELEKANLDFDPDAILDNGYKRHLLRHSNKVLLRVRLLYYLRQEIIGEEADKVFQGVCSSDIDIPSPWADGEPPAPWWDEDCDRSLLIGVFKHGYEKYNVMRQDSALDFLSRCGPPDGEALAREQNDDYDNDKDDEDELEDKAVNLRDEEGEGDVALGLAPGSSRKIQKLFVGLEGENGKFPFPTPSDLNTRLRRVITGYQRNHKREQQKIQQKAKRMERRVKAEAVVKEKEVKKRESQQRWSRREEADFYRTVSTFGVEYNKATGVYRWDRFRCFARLDKKYDDTLVEYFHAFYYMCQRVCGKFKNDKNAKPPNNILVEPITEERASRCLARIDLLNKIREEILISSKLDEHVKLCQPSFDMPSWWQCGKHDKELLIGAARHGVARTDYHILRDPTLSFHELLKSKNLRQSHIPYGLSPYGGMPMGMAEVNTPVKEEKCDIDSKESKSVKTENGDVDPESKEIKEKDSDMGLSWEESKDISQIKDEIKEEKEDCEEIKENKEESEDKLETDETKIQNSSENGNKDETESEDAFQEEGEKTSDEKDEQVEEDNSDFVKLKKKCVQEESNSGKETQTENDVKPDLKAKMKREEEMMRDGFTQYSRHYIEDSSFLDMDGPEPGEIVLGRSMLGTPIDWPKDRVIFHRLEHICYTIDNGEWPFARRPAPQFFPPAAFDSRSATPVGASTPKGELVVDSDAGDSLVETPQVKRGSGENDKDFEVLVSEGEGLKMTFHKRGRGRRRRYEIDAERAARVQQLLNQSAASAASSDNESQPEPVNLSSVIQPSSDSFPNGSSPARFDASQLSARLMEHGLLPERKRRGRKRKAEKMAELAMAEALAKRHQARLLSSMDPDAKIPVICIEDGSRLSGEEAPLRKDIERWLLEHPNYILDQSSLVDEEEPGEIAHHLMLPEHFDRPRGRGRRPRVDPRTLEVGSLTGEENVSVVDRETGKKITGAKAPPLKHLAEWLEKNPAYDVEAKWGELVRAKGSLPKSLDSRILKPSGRGRKPKDSMFQPSYMSGEFTYPPVSMAAMTAFPGAGLMGSFPKLPLNMPFGAIPNLGMANPMLGLTGFGFPSIPMTSSLTKSSEGESKEKDSEKGEDSDNGDSKPGTSTPHPSFPSFYYSPLLYNPLLAAQSLRNFQIPTSLPTSFAGLAQPGAVNGRMESESEEDTKMFEDGQDEAEDLSVKKSNSSRKPKDMSFKNRSHKEGNSVRKQKHTSSVSVQEEATDLSVKSKPTDNKLKKSKIFSSSKLNKIVDSLKDKVMKIEKKDKKPSDDPPFQSEKVGKSEKTSEVEESSGSEKPEKVVEKNSESEEKSETRTETEACS